MLMDVVRELSSGKYEGRATGTPGGVAAGRAIEARFRRLGLEPVGGRAYRHPFELRRIANGRTDGPLTGANIVGALPGSRTGAGYLVVSAHYDHVGVVNGRLHPGADDNASGVAVLISAAGHFVRHRPVHPMMFVAFDGEELNLAGSKAFMARPPVPVSRLRLVVNLDMVSRSARKEIFAAGTSHHPVLRPPLERVRARASVRLSFGHDRAEDASREDWTDDSDHWPFHQAGVPFVYFGVEDHADYHQPTDTPDRIDEDFFSAVAEMIVDAIGELDRM